MRAQIQVRYLMALIANILTVSSVKKLVICIYKFFKIIQIPEYFRVDLWRDFQSFSNRMLMAGLISKRVPCMHGGLSPHLTSLEQIRQIKHPCEPLVSVQLTITNAFVVFVVYSRLYELLTQNTT